MTAGRHGEAGALWAGPSLARLRWESHSCELSTCRCHPSLASTRGDQASRVSAPFSKERAVCPSTLDSELAARFLPSLGVAGPPAEALSGSLTDGPWFQAHLGLCWGRLFLKGKMMWAIATAHKPEEPKAV